MTLISLALMLVMLAQAVEAGPAATPAAPIVAAKASDPADKVSCIMEQRTGSNFAVKTCHTRRDWIALEKQKSEASRAGGEPSLRSLCTYSGGFPHC